MKEDDIKKMVKRLKQDNRMVKRNLNIGYDQYNRYLKLKPLTQTQAILAKCIHCRIIQYAIDDPTEMCPILTCPLHDILRKRLTKDDLKN